MKEYLNGYDDTLEALKGSIAKWEAIVAGTGEDHGIDNCHLCKKFYYYDCEDCPVAIASGASRCCGTPYEDWDEIVDSRYFPRKVRGPSSKAVAQAELDFLKSLLP